MTLIKFYTCEFYDDVGCEERTKFIDMNWFYQRKKKMCK